MSAIDAGVPYGEHMGLKNASTARTWPSGPYVFTARVWLNTYHSRAWRPLKPLPPGLRGSGSTARFWVSMSCRTIARFWASSGVGLAKLLRSATVGSAAVTATLPVIEAWPSDVIAGSAECENDGRSVNRRL